MEPVFLVLAAIYLLLDSRLDLNEARIGPVRLLVAATSAVLFIAAMFVFFFKYFSNG